MTEKQAGCPGAAGDPGYCSTLDEDPTRSATIISEFYRLRRTAIKDIAAYLGFLVGFIGSAPFAWGLLAVQLDAGRFARGLWYFFGIVTTAGIFAGIAGMGLGVAAGLLWELVHRYRRGRKVTPYAEDAANPQPDAFMMTAERQAAMRVEPPRLQLITPAPAPLPNLAGRRVTSVRFTTSGLALDFGGVTLTVTGTATISTPGGRYTYPDSGSRDALCALLDSRVVRVRAVAGDRIEILNDNGDTLVIPRSNSVTSDIVARQLNES